MMMPDLMRLRRLLSHRVFFDVLEVSRDLNSDAACADASEEVEGFSSFLTV